MRRRAGDAIAGALLHVAVGGVVEQRRREEVERRFQLGEVEVLPLAGAVAAAERGDDRGGSEPGHDEVGVGLVGPGGVARGPAGEVVEAGKAREGAPEAHVAGEGAGLPLHRQADHHEVGLDLAKLLVAEALALDYAGGEALGHDVGDGGEAPGDFLRLRFRQVEADAALRGVVVGEVAGLVDAGLALQERRPQAAAVDADAAFDLDHLGAEEREELRGHGSGDGPTEVDDAHARQGQVSLLSVPFIR